MSYHLLFKVKNNNSLYKVISKCDEDIMIFDHDAEQIVYSAATTLDENQCFKIEDFSMHKYTLEFLKKEFTTAEYAQWDRSLTRIEYILHTNGKKYLFQKYTKSQLIAKTWVSLSGEPRLRSERMIVLSPFANACYDKQKDVLFFKKLPDIKNIFPGIENLYRIATQKEVNEFLESNLLNTDQYNRDKLGILNRKRITSVHNELSNIKNIEEFCTSLQEYYPINMNKSGKIIIKTEEDLKNVLFALQERFYTTPRSNEKRLANSIVKI